MFIKKLKSILKIFSEDMSIANKLRIFMIVIVIVPVIILNSSFYNMLQDIYRQQLEQSYEHTIEQYHDKIKYKLELYTNLLNNVTVNGTVQDIFRKQYDDSGDNRVDITRMITTEINSIVSKSTNNELYNVTLYPLNQDFPSDGIYLGKFSDIQQEEWYGEVIENKKYGGFFFTQSSGSKIDLLSLVIPIFNTDGMGFYDILGIAKLDLNANILLNFDDSETDLKEIPLAVLDTNYNVVYSDNADENLLKSFQDADVFSKTKNLYWRNGNVIVYKKDIVNNLITVLLFSGAQWQERLMDIRVLIMGVNAILIVILVLLIIAFSNIMIKRIRILIEKMKQVEEGSLDISVVIGGKDEVAELDSCFNSMIVRIKTLIDEKYVQQLEKTKAELKALQYQINPHFLYNTLEVISQMASLHMYSHISTISQKLGEMLRYNIDKTENCYVTLEKEIYHIKNYVQIQQIRFDNSFDIMYDISDEAMEFKIFKFMLQPLIENALMHGFDGIKYRGYIEIAASVDNDELCIKVQDNGKGMSKEKVELLMENINQKEDYFGTDKKNSIGLQNVHHRIKLIYGEQYGLRINSKENSGTQIIIKIPKM